VQPVRVVTISAQYGAGGSRIGPLVAARLGWRFLDRAISAEVAERLEVPLTNALSHEEPEGGAFKRLLAGMANAAPPEAAAVLAGGQVSEADFVAVTEQVVREAAAGGEVVVLGRAAVAILRDWPEALRVRLFGSPEQRLAQAMDWGGLDERTARRRQGISDRSRDGYLRRFYRAESDDPALYHLLVDSTALPFDACVDLICGAAQTGLRSR
jgi:cytidylate kinase